MATPSDPTAELMAEIRRDFGKPCDLNKISALIAAGARLDAVDKNNNTLLHLCVAENRDAATVRALAAAGVPLETRNESGHTPLTFAATNGRTEIALALIATKADINAKTSGGNSPLVLALPHKAVAKALIEAGADIDALSKGMSTPLMLAVVHNLADIAGILLKRGADPDKARDDGKTPYEVAISSSPTIAGMIRQAKKQRQLEAEIRAVTAQKEMGESLGAAAHAGTESPVTVMTLRLKPKQPGNAA